MATRKKTVKRTVKRVQKTRKPARVKEQVIWKLSGHGNHELPKGYKILFGKDRSGTPKVWALVDPTAKKVTVELRVIRTGAPFPKGFEYVGSYDSSPTSHILVGPASNHSED